MNILLTKFSLEDLLNYSMVELPECIENGINEAQKEMQFELEELKEDRKDLDEYMTEKLEEIEIVLKSVKENKNTVSFKNEDFQELKEFINNINYIF